MGSYKHQTIDPEIQAEKKKISSSKMAATMNNGLQEATVDLRVMATFFRV